MDDLSHLFDHILPVNEIVLASKPILASQYISYMTSTNYCRYQLQTEYRTSPGSSTTSTNLSRSLQVLQFSFGQLDPGEPR